jgi:hypothetical protein
MSFIHHEFDQIMWAAARQEQHRRLGEQWKDMTADERGRMASEDYILDLLRDIAERICREAKP